MGKSGQTILVTGGSGFIGSNFIRYVLGSEADVLVINYDLLTYAGNLKNNEEVATDERYAFVRGDIADAEQLENVFDQNIVDVVVNFCSRNSCGPVHRRCRPVRPLECCRDPVPD